MFFIATVQSYDHYQQPKRLYRNMTRSTWSMSPCAFFCVCMDTCVHRLWVVRGGGACLVFVIVVPSTHNRLWLAVLYCLFFFLNDCVDILLRNCYEWKRVKHFRRLWMFFGWRITCLLVTLKRVSSCHHGSTLCAALASQHPRTRILRSLLFVVLCCCGFCIPVVFMYSRCFYVFPLFLCIPVVFTKHLVSQDWSMRNCKNGNVCHWKRTAD